MSRSTSNQWVTSITEVSPIPDDSDDEGESELGAGHVEQPARLPCRRLFPTISVTVGRSDDEAGNEIV